MPGTITTDLTTIDPADATTNWATVGTWSTAPAAVDDPRIQGTFCIQGRNTNTSGWAGAAAGGLDFTTTHAGKHVFLWMQNTCTASTDSIANGGQAVFVCSDASMSLTGTSPSNGPNNSKQWYVNGNNGIKTGGWICYVVDPNSTPTLALGTPNLASIQRIGLRVKTISTIATNTRNIMWDALRYGTGLIINDGTAGSPVALADIFSADSAQANAWGVLTNVSDVYYLAGKLNFGTTGQSALTYFKDTNQTVVCKNFPVATTFYEIKLSGAASFNTTVQMGNYAGGLASDGLTIKGAGDLSGTNHSVWTLTADASNTVFTAYACSFSELRRASLNSSSELRSCTLSNFGDVTASGALIDGCTFQNVKTGSPVSGGSALVINSPAEINSKVTNCKFINCNRAIKITAAGTYTFDNLTFSGNSYDIENSSSGLVTIQIQNGSNPTTYINTGGGTTSFEASAVLTINIVDAEGNAVTQNCEVTVVKASDETVLFTEDNVIDGTTSYSYSSGAGTVTYINILNVAGYQPKTVNNYALLSSNATLTVQLDTDPFYSNP